jgi:TonB-dependent SusC/RagA subfamily outer membrane receptor
MDKNKLDKKTASSDIIYTVVKQVEGDKSSEIISVGKEFANAPKEKTSINVKKEKPLIVIDGVISTEGNLNKINPTTIESMNVLKGENAKAKYAEKGANGVIEITTKKP